MADQPISIPVALAPAAFHSEAGKGKYLTFPGPLALRSGHVTRRSRPQESGRVWLWEIMSPHDKRGGGFQLTLNLSCLTCKRRCNARSTAVCKQQGKAKRITETPALALLAGEAVPATAGLRARCDGQRRSCRRSHGACFPLLWSARPSPCRDGV